MAALALLLARRAESGKLVVMSATLDAAPVAAARRAGIRVWGELELAWRYEERDYSGITPGVGESRDDQRHRWQADFELPVTEKGAIQLYGGYSDYSSNYQPADYDQNVVGTRFIYRW